MKKLLVFIFCLIAVIKNVSGSESCSGLVGETVAVRGFENKLILVGETPDDLKELLDAVIANDQRWIAQLIFSGKSFSISPGTEVAILKCDNYRGMVKIRILSSKSELSFYVGWTYTDMLLGTE